VAEWLHGQPQSDITDHQVYYFKCLGAGPEKNRWLDGRTNEGTVGLVPITTWPYTGTDGELRLTDGAWAFRWQQMAGRADDEWHGRARTERSIPVHGRSLAGAARPRRPRTAGCPRRTFQVQKRRKPARCQAMTVSGCTMASAERQSLQMRHSNTHTWRSPAVNLGRFLADR
jgi:hypothetical protein